MNQSHGTQSSLDMICKTQYVRHTTSYPVFHKQNKCIIYGLLKFYGEKVQKQTKYHIFVIMVNRLLFN